MESESQGMRHGSLVGGSGTSMFRGFHLVRSLVKSLALRLWTMFIAVVEVKPTWCAIGVFTANY